MGNFSKGHNLLGSEEEEQFAGGRVLYTYVCMCVCPSKLLLPAMFQEKQKNVAPKLIYLYNARSGVKKMPNGY